MRRTIFYSWQSDLPNKTNRGLIQAALEEAAKAITVDDTVAVEPVIDRDTQGMPGSPDIGAAIFDKIAKADLFVADVSIVSRPRKRRPTPNPNVLIELGYALKALGPDRIILVFNRAFGKLEELPFDLKMRRSLPYDMAEDAAERAPERAGLAKALEKAIRTGLSHLPVAEAHPTRTASEVIQEMLASPVGEMQLDAYVGAQVRELLETSSPSELPVQGTAVNKQEFLVRIKKYDEMCRKLEETFAVIARWGDKPQVLARAFTRIAEAAPAPAGSTLWLSLRWYPCLRLMYATGIAALSAKKYEALAACLVTGVPDRYQPSRRVPVIIPTIDELTQSVEQFKWVPGHEQQYVARSEYLMESLKEALESLLFLGGSYEELFDEFEVLMALAYGTSNDHTWAPPGRFAWKNRREEGPYRRIVQEAGQQGEAWGPVKAQLFKGANQDLVTFAKAYQEVLDRLGWF